MYRMYRESRVQLRCAELQSVVLVEDQLCIFMSNLNTPVLTVTTPPAPAATRWCCARCVVSSTLGIAVLYW